MENGETVTVVVGGIYGYTNPMENEVNVPAVFRFENLIFAHPDLVNQLRGELDYLEAHFYVTDPTVILETQYEIVSLLQGTSFDTRVSDTLFQRISGALTRSGNLVKMILTITVTATIAVVILLLML